MAKELNMIWAGYVACEGMMIRAHETLIGKFDGKGPRGRRNRKWKDNNKKRWNVPGTVPVVAQRVWRGIALLFHEHGTRRGWVVSSTPRPYFTPWKDPLPIVQEAGWVQGPVWRGGKSRPTGIRSPDRPARSQSLYRLSHPAYKWEDSITANA